MQQSKRALRAKMKKKAANRARNKGMDLTIKTNHDREVMNQLKATRPLLSMADGVLQQFTNAFGNNKVTGPQDQVDNLVKVLDKVKADSDELRRDFTKIEEVGKQFVANKGGDYIGWTQESIGICEELNKLREDHSHRYSLNMLTVQEILHDVKCN